MIWNVVQVHQRKPHCAGRAPAVHRALRRQPLIVAKAHRAAPVEEGGSRQVLDVEMIQLVPVGPAIEVDPIAAVCRRPLARFECFAQLVEN